MTQPLWLLKHLIRRQPDVCDMVVGCLLLILKLHLVLLLLLFGFLFLLLLKYFSFK